MPDLRIPYDPEAGPLPCCAWKSEDRESAGGKVHLDTLVQGVSIFETPQGLASECGVTILGFEVCFMMTGNGPRMWLFNFLGTSLVCNGTWLICRIFPVASTVLEEQPTRLSTHVASIASLRVPKTTLTFHNLLERLRECTKSCYTRGYSLLQLKSTDENQPREVEHGAESRKVPNTEVPVCFSLWCHGECALLSWH